MAQNDGRHIVSIIGMTECKKHEALLHEPCYIIPADTSDKILFGICNKRAKLGGANGKISATSYATAQKTQKRREQKKYQKAS